MARLGLEHICGRIQQSQSGMFFCVHCMQMLLAVLLFELKVKVACNTSHQFECHGSFAQLYSPNALPAYSVSGNTHASDTHTEMQTQRHGA